jgi:dephospho-CoA kinase
MQKIIGLTGLYCAGKNFVAALLEKRGVPVLDVDKLGHTAIEREKEAIVARFGGDVLTADGKIDRRLLGGKVFGSAGELAALEAIVHPAANALTEEWIAAQSAARVAGHQAEAANGSLGRNCGEDSLCVINAALLHKSSVFGRLDRIIVVRAPLLVRLIRAKKRDRLPLTSLIKRFNSQKEFFSQYFAQNADKKRSVVNINNGFLHSKRHLEQQLNKVILDV